MRVGTVHSPEKNSAHKRAKIFMATPNYVSSSSLTRARRIVAVIMIINFVTSCASSTFASLEFHFLSKNLPLEKRE